MPIKPHRWGYKMFILPYTKDIVYDLGVYSGKMTKPNNSSGIGLSGNVVLALCRTVHTDFNHLLCIYNWFTSLKLFKEL